MVGSGVIDQGTHTHAHAILPALTQTISLAHNRICGELPPSVGRLGSLRVLTLTNNQCVCARACMRACVCIMCMCACVRACVCGGGCVTACTISKVISPHWAVYNYINNAANNSNS